MHVQASHAGGTVPLLWPSCRASEHLSRQARGGGAHPNPIAASARAQVVVSLEDVSTEAGARAAVAAAAALAPLAGVLHLAMLLQDAPLASQARRP